MIRSTPAATARDMTASRSSSCLGRPWYTPLNIGSVMFAPMSMKRPPPPPPWDTTAAIKRAARASSNRHSARTACFPEIHFGIANFSEMHILMAPFPRLFDLIWIRDGNLGGPGGACCWRCLQAARCARGMVCMVVVGAIGTL